MTRNIVPATHPEEGRVHIEIEFENGKLSIIGSTKNSGGQTTEILLDSATVPSGKWTHDDLIKLHDIWKRWHLNDMRA